MGLQAGGAPASLVRPPGTPGAVQGFRAFGSPLSGGRLTTALPNNIRLYFGDGGSSLVISAGGQTLIAITAAGIVYAPGTLNVLKTTLVQATSAAMAYTGQAVSVGSNRIIQVIAGAIAYVAQDVTLLRQYRAFVTAASKTYVSILVNSYNIVASTYVGFISRVSNYLGIRF
jgi:hypothetical protein